MGYVDPPRQAILVMTVGAFASSMNSEVHVARWYVPGPSRAASYVLTLALEDGT